MLSRTACCTLFQYNPTLWWKIAYSLIGQGALDDQILSWFTDPLHPLYPPASRLKPVMLDATNTQDQATVSRKRWLRHRVPSECRKQCKTKDMSRESMLKPRFLKYHYNCRHTPTIAKSWIYTTKRHSCNWKQNQFHWELTRCFLSVDTMLYHDTIVHFYSS